MTDLIRRRNVERAMSKWVVRGQYATGDVVEEFGSEAEARAAQQRHREAGVPVATLGPPPAGPVVPDRGSFCGKQRPQVSRLIAGPAGAGVAICDQCVALCNAIIAGTSQS
jgi:hypothetical protein